MQAAKAHRSLRKRTGSLEPLLYADVDIASNQMYKNLAPTGSLRMDDITLAWRVLSPFNKVYSPSS